MKFRHIFFISAAIFSFFLLIHFGLANIFGADITPSPDKLIPQDNTFSQVPGGSNKGKYDLFRDFIPAVIQTSLEVIGAVMLAFLIYAGILLVISGANENFKEKSKKIFFNVLIGALIVSLAYAVVYGITQLNITGS